MPSSFRLYQRLHLINIQTFAKVEVIIIFNKKLTYYFSIKDNFTKNQTIYLYK